MRYLFFISIIFLAASCRKTVNEPLPLNTPAPVTAKPDSTETHSNFVFIKDGINSSYPVSLLSGKVNLEKNYITISNSYFTISFDALNDSQVINENSGCNFHYRWHTVGCSSPPGFFKTNGEGEPEAVEADFINGYLKIISNKKPVNNADPDKTEVEFILKGVFKRTHTFFTQDISYPELEFHFKSWEEKH
jgi:hypothetical protein